MKTTFWTRVRTGSIKLIFGLLLIWPPIHATAAKLLGFSSWRLFGWGMYAMPHPESLSSLSVIVLSGFPRFPNDDHTYQQISENVLQEFEKTWQITENSCFDVLHKKAGEPLSRIQVGDICERASVENDLAFFKHFRSTGHLVSLVDAVRDSVTAQDSSWQGNEVQFASIVIKVKQRINLSARTAYLEKDLFFIKNREVKFIGKWEGPNFARSN